jgi:hypothetical protein
MNASLFVIVVDSRYRFIYAFLFGYSFIDVIGHHSRPLQQAQKTMNMFLVKLSKFVFLCCNILLEHLKPIMRRVK